MFCLPGMQTPFPFTARKAPALLDFLFWVIVRAACADTDGAAVSGATFRWLDIARATSRGEVGSERASRPCHT